MFSILTILLSNMERPRGSAYSLKGTGIRYDPRARSQVTPTQAPEHRSRTEDSQTGTDVPDDPTKGLAPEELEEQKKSNESESPGVIDSIKKWWSEKKIQSKGPTNIEEVNRTKSAERDGRADALESGSTYSMQGTGIHYDSRERSQVAPAQLPAHRSRTEASQTGTDEPYDPKKLLTPEELDEQKAALEAIERRHQANHQRRGQSSNNSTIPIRSAPTESRKKEPIQCIVCDDEMATVKFQPCGHRIACPQCSARMKKCMSCQVAIKRKINAEGQDVVAGDVVIDKDMVKKNQELEDTLTCAICLDRRRNMVFLCGHSACQECAQSLQQCHMCREKITKRINIFT